MPRRSVRRRPSPASGPGDLHAQIAARLAARGQRYTVGRRRLVQVLATAARPLTTPEIQARPPRLALSSVYRNLVVLEQAGVLRRVVTREDSARFELAERFTAHHHHLTCRDCGAVLDYTAPPALEREIARALARLPDASGFTPGGHHLEISGLCAACRAAGQRR